MNPDKLIYWRRTIEVLALVGALLVVGIFWQTAPPTVVPAILELLGIALGVGQSPIGNPSSVVKSMRPPPYDVHVPTIPSPPPDMVIIPPPPTAAPKGTP